MNLTTEEKSVLIAALEDLLDKLFDEIGDTDEQDEAMDGLKRRHCIATQLLRRLS